MTTLDVVPKKTKPEPSAEETAAIELVRLAREQGLSLTGPDGLLKQFTKSVLETALNEEMTEHLGVLDTQEVRGHLLGGSGGRGPRIPDTRPHDRSSASPGSVLFVTCHR